MMRIFPGWFLVIERDDAVLMPVFDGHIPQDRDFQRVNVLLDDGIVADDINSNENVVMLQSHDNNVIRFTKGSRETWDKDYDRWTADGWIVIGFDAVRYYPTESEYLNSLEE